MVFLINKKTVVVSQSRVPVGKSFGFGTSAVDVEESMKTLRRLILVDSIP